MTDHDRLFKELLTTFFVEFLELFLPRMASLIDRDAVGFLPQEYFADLTTGETKIVDLLAQVQLAGEEAGFLIHIENQSSSEADFSRRMFFYFARLHQKYLQRIYPIVIFSFDQPYREESHRYTVGFDDLQVVDFNFCSIQLNRLNWRDYLTQRNPVAAALMAKMQIEPRDRPKVKAECLRLLATLQLDRARSQLISGFIDVYLQLSGPEEQMFRAEIDKLEATEQEGVMEIVTSWMQQGLEQGLEQGIEQGIEQGSRQEARSLILRLLARKVGTLPDSTHQQIDQLPIARLEALAEALLDFADLADLERWLMELQ